MRASQNLILVGLLALAGGAFAGLLLTRTSPDARVQSNNGSRGTAAGDVGVDQRALETAQKLAAWAATAQEQQLARRALRVADHETDVAYASALRNANEESGAKPAATRPIEDRIRRTQVKISSDREKVNQLTAQAGSLKARDPERLQRELELARAELDLDQDEMADAQEDLLRAGGDLRSRLQRLLEEHEAAQHAGGPVQGNPGQTSAPEAVLLSGSLIAKWRAWGALREERAQLIGGQRDALSAAAALSRKHETLEQQVGQSKENGQTRQATNLVGRDRSGGVENDHAASNDTAVLSTLRHLSRDEKNLADLDKRVGDLRELASIYGQWSSLISDRQRASLHEIIKSGLWIILTVLAVLLAGRFIDRFLAGLSLERKRQLTLRALVRFALQVITVFVIVFIILGSPSQMPTILGLAGAGLTVALKDFIVSFFGWFVLMGRNGIRVGDWVEIKGVRGEVIEIALLRTVLLETGNWTEAGHPTGRQVAFLNSFAVEGYYFNFSTAGQWLWDELRVFVPSGENAYPLIEQIRAIVTKETENNATLAEQEWQRVTRRYGVRSLSAAPAVDVRITDPGLEVVVRYITRADQRSEARSRLNHAIIKLLHRGEAITTEPEKPAASLAPSGDFGPEEVPNR